MYSHVYKRHFTLTIFFYLSSMCYYTMGKNEKLQLLYSNSSLTKHIIHNKIRWKNRMYSDIALAFCIKILFSLEEKKIRQPAIFFKPKVFFFLPNKQPTNEQIIFKVLLSVYTYREKSSKTDGSPPFVLYWEKNIFCFVKSFNFFWILKNKFLILTTNKNIKFTFFFWKQ